MCAVTVVLTTVWCELMADPKLFERRKVRTRDHKILGVGALFIGAFAGRAVLQETSAAGALGVGTGMKVVIALSFLFVPAKANSPPAVAKGGKPGQVQVA